MRNEKAIAFRVNPADLWRLRYICEFMGWHGMKHSQVMRRMIEAYAEDLKQRDPEKAREWHCPV